MDPLGKLREVFYLPLFACHMWYFSTYTAYQIYQEHLPSYTLLFITYLYSGTSLLDEISGAT